jgi:hypothetical protein
MAAKTVSLYRTRTTGLPANRSTCPVKYSENSRPQSTYFEFPENWNAFKELSGGRGNLMGWKGTR